MERSVESSVSRSCFSPPHSLSRGVFPWRASRVLGKGSGAFESSDVTNFTDDLPGDDNAAPTRCMQCMSRLSDEIFELLFKFRNLLTDIKKAFHFTLHGTHKKRRHIFWSGFHPVFECLE